MQEKVIRTGLKSRERDPVEVCSHLQSMNEVKTLTQWNEYLSVNLITNKK